jgi:hypothetical protein
MGLFDFKYSHQELKSRVIKVLSTKILLSNTLELRKFHVALFKKGFNFFEDSAKAVGIDMYHSIRYSSFYGGQFTATFGSGYYQITSISEFVNLVNNTSP